MKRPETYVEQWIEPVQEHFFNTSTGSLLMTVIAIIVVILIVKKK